MAFVTASGCPKVMGDRRGEVWGSRYSYTPLKYFKFGTVNVIFGEMSETTSHYLKSVRTPPPPPLPYKGRGTVKNPELFHPYIWEI